MRTALLLILTTLSLLLCSTFQVGKVVVGQRVQHGATITNHQADYVFECNWSSIYAENILSRQTQGSHIFARRIAPTTTPETLSALALSRKVHSEHSEHNLTITSSHSRAYSIKYHRDYYQYTLCCIRI